ncbi:cell death regulator aven-like [Plakobranchus ocellatus]|uniref:Cell death regulator aven-like n=1 Tax=Plakobranchus ocellatus TaxID=259542 RepID=A0AAV3YMX4_9GAST|nr:cell death regulator aven-like [Plakobranchus ocellatus]
MRPDEHKKKKNAAYKKKHGIGTTKAQGEDNTKSKKGAQDERASQRKNLGDEGKKDVVTQKKGQTKAPSASSESETEELEKPKRNFQRRKIVSNWEKYEVQPSDEQPEARGESFQKLLSMSGDAVAHFRFRDEKEWDTVGALADCDSKVNDDQFGQYLNIDTQQIGKAMACLPLYKVLGLKPNIFPSDEVQSMDSTASENRASYMQTQPIYSTPLVSSLDSNLGTREDSSKQKDISRDSIDNSLEEQQAVSLTSEGATSFDHVQTNEAMSTDPFAKTNAYNSTQTTSQKLSLQDEDLDSLLDLDHPGDSSPSKKANAQYQLKTSELRTKPKEMAERVISDTSNILKTASFMSQQEESPKKSADLEDWLDSILDD